MTIQSATRRPTRVSFIQFTGDNVTEISTWTRGAFRLIADPSPDAGPQTAEVYDRVHAKWIPVSVEDRVMAGPRGEFYPCAPDTFADLYDLASIEDAEVAV